MRAYLMFRLLTQFKTWKSQLVHVKSAAGLRLLFLEVDMIAINDLSWNKISFSRKGERVEVVRKLGRKTIFKNRDGVKFSVDNSLVGLYFCQEAVTDQGGSKSGWVL